MTVSPSQTRSAVVGLPQARAVAEGAGGAGLPVVASAVGAEEPLRTRPLG